ncbi:MAG: hypothetical protein WBA91_08965 [Paracoccaceae bacterium]
MSEDLEIARKLAALGGERAIFRDGLRLISNGLVPPPLVAILEEIDNTVLRRRLTFHIADRALSLIVAGRRAISFAPQPAEAGDAVDAQPLSGEDTEGFEAFVALLQGFAAKGEALSVESEPLADPGAGRAEFGVSVTRLAEALQIDLDTGPTPPMQQFLDSCGDKISAHLWRSGAEDWISGGGDAGQQALLRAVADTKWQEFRTNYARIGQQSGPTQLVLLQEAIAPGVTLSACWDGDATALFSHQAAELPAIHSLWRRIFTK